jgi:hypothetical protein
LLGLFFHPEDEGRMTTARIFSGAVSFPGEAAKLPQGSQKMFLQIYISAMLDCT